MYQVDHEGRMLVPVAWRDGDTIADSAQWIGRDHPDRATWDRWLAEHPEVRPPADVDKAAGPDPKAPASGAPATGAPTPPPDDRWPGWIVDVALTAAVAMLLTRALTRGVDIRAVARAAARQWPDAAPSTAEAVSWLRDRYGQGLADALTPAVEDALTQGYLVGARSAEAILDAGADPRNPGITISADWSHWRPGDARAARAILSADGREVELAKLLASAGVTIKGIAEQRLDELAAVLADGLERGASPKEIAVALRGIVANPAWANTVAWTETARAQSAAASEIYAQRGVARNEWMTAHDQRVCPLCAANDAAGPVDVGTPFPSGDVHPPGHPRCRCALVPTLDDLGKMVWAELLKVGPKGYVHGWIKVGAPGVKGERVHHPDLGHGTVTRPGIATTGITFDSGEYAAFEHGGTGDGHFIERPTRARKPRKTAAKPPETRPPRAPRKATAGAEAVPAHATVTGESSDPSTWRATGIEGVDKPGAGVLTAITAYVRRPGDLNRRLRGGRASEPTFDELMGRGSMDPERERKAAAKIDRQVAGVDKLMARSQTTAPMTVYRGTSGHRYESLHVGDTFTDPGFVSTALDRKVAEHSFAGEGRTLLTIHAPQGTHAIHIGGLGESEVLLGRGQTFRVIADHGIGRGKMRRLDVEIVPIADLGKSARAVATGHEGDAEQLHHYWTRGEGVGKWIKARHPWRTLRRHLAQFIHDPVELDKTTAQWFKDATGMWSGERKGKNPAGPG